MHYETCSDIWPSVQLRQGGCSLVQLLYSVAGVSEIQTTERLCSCVCSFFTRKALTPVQKSGSVQYACKPELTALKK